MADAVADARGNASSECFALYGELSAYTISLRDAAFLHQLAVDSYGAQHAGGSSPSIHVVFGAVGLYLTCERGYSGRRVQRAHMVLARGPRTWPVLRTPMQASWLTVTDVTRHSPGPSAMLPSERGPSQCGKRGRMNAPAS